MQAWQRYADGLGWATIAGVLAIVIVLVGAVVAVLARRRRAAVGVPDSSGPAVARDLPGLRQGLAKTRAGMFQRILPLLGRQRLDAEALGEIEAALLAADVGIETTQRLLACVQRRDRAGAAPRVALEEEIVAILDAAKRAGDAGRVTPADGTPLVLMVVGVNGVGKTTSIGKLAARFVRNGHRTLLVAADTFRAAAIEQLTVWAERSGADLVRQEHGGDPGAVAFDGMRAGMARKAGVVIVDTAGRLHTKSNLLEELRKVRRVIAREIPGAPHETLLVVDAVTGQNGLVQARAFLDQIDITGVILTKLDGTARGGIVLAIAGGLNLPIRYIGVGEGIDDLREFDAREFASALLAPTEEPGSP
ncbi:MAG: signal recognition particle-docking protein FtsY [Deltaproteobacteria bacterium]|nr:signal recognition particle-docking protein FtsY [Deltaproteobacteria bacterium]